MNDREYRRLKAEAEAEYRRKLDAIEMVWQLSGGGAKNGAQASSTVSKGALLNAVRDAISHVNSEFTLNEIEAYIARTNPQLAATIKRPSLSSALKRLEKQAVIVVSVRGSGKRASKYKRGSVATG